MLSELVLSELFDIRYIVKDHIIEFVVDELWKNRVKVVQVMNCDSTIYMDLLNNDHVGELKIDRFAKRFVICLRDGENIIPPAVGNWAEIKRYLDIVIPSNM